MASRFQLKNDLILNAEVTKLEIVNKSCGKIVFKQKGEEHTIKSKYVISTNDVETLYTKILPKNTVSQKFIKKLNDAVLYSSALTVSIALDCLAEDLGFNQELICITKEGIKRDDHDCGDPLLSDISVIAPSARDKSLTPEGKGLISLLIPAYIDYKDYWQTERDENGNYVRGERYKKLKTKIAETLIQRVEKDLSIDIKKQILFYDGSTPISYLRYTGNKNGTMMGARPGNENMQAGIAHHQTAVKNLILSGHWSDLGGGVPISVKAAINAVLLVLKKDNIGSFKLLAKYMDGKLDLDQLNTSSLVKEYDNSWKF